MRVVNKLHIKSGSKFDRCNDIFDRKLLFSKEKKPIVIQFLNFTIFLYLYTCRALCLKGINMASKWPRPSNPL